MTDENGLIDISGLTKAEVLAALYNRSHQQGMGFIHACGATGMTVEQAQAEIDEALKYAYRPGEAYFDYLHGRVMKIRLDDTGKLNPRLYDRDLGDGAARATIDGLRASKTEPKASHS